MSAPKFTPGPWRLRRTKSRLEVDIGAGSSYAFVHADEANANLIAAAPELYDALEELIAAHESAIHDEYDGTGMTQELLSSDDLVAARAALAKARGESEVQA